MSDTKTPAELAYKVHTQRICRTRPDGKCFDVGWNQVAAATLIQADRRAVASAARAEGEAAGYRRAVEEIAAWLDDAVFVRLSSFSTNQQSLGGSIRAKFGGQ